MKLVISAMLTISLLCGIAIGVMLSGRRSANEKRLARLESRVLNIESDPLLAKSFEERLSDQVAAEQLEKDAYNLKVYAYGFSKGVGKMVNLDESEGDISLQGWKLHFNLWREEDREKSRAVLVVRTDESGRFQVALPPGEYSEIQLTGGSLPEGYAFTHNGYPVRDVTIARDWTVDLPPVEITKNPQQASARDGASRHP